jgi:hypothetical protein
MQKIVSMIRMYLVDEVLIKYELDRNRNGLDESSPRVLNQAQDSIISYSRNKKQIQLKYKLKCHHMHVLYLLLKFAPEYLTNEFPKYCQALLEYFPALRPDQFCLQTLIRVWIYGMCLRN